MIIWDGFDILCLIILVIGGIILGFAWLWDTIQNKIDKYFEKRENK